jgi:multiple sugar transport system permease protein
VIFMIYLSTIMLPLQVTMIPLYIIFRKVGWIGTFYPLIVPAFFGTGLLTKRRLPRRESR